MPVDGRPPRAHRVEHLDRLTVADERQPGALGADRPHVPAAAEVMENESKAADRCARDAKRSVAQTPTIRQH